MSYSIKIAQKFIRLLALLLQETKMRRMEEKQILVTTAAVSVEGAAKTGEFLISRGVEGGGVVRGYNCKRSLCLGRASEARGEASAALNRSSRHCT